MRPIARSVRGRRWSWPLALSAWAPCAACAPPEPVPRVLVLERFQPASRQGIFLNEDLVLTFSADLDRDSVTDDSFCVVDEAGRPARGRRLVLGRTLRFQPAPVLAPDLSDGGYRPNTTYRVVLRGFPHLGAMRDENGAPLQRSEVFEVHTVAVAGQGAERGSVFDDASPGRSHALLLETQRAGSSLLYQDEPIRLTCEEPLDPSTLDDSDFVLDLELAGDARRIPVRARFLTNYDEDEQPPGQPCARIELLPLERLERGAVLWLRRGRDFDLRDFGGNPVLGRGLGEESQKLTVGVSEEPRQLAEDRLTLDFMDTSRFIPVRVAGVDGTLAWGLAGTLAVRYPAAAGTGEAGPVTLGDEELPADLHATRIELPRGSRCVLPPGGLAVLRAQGTLRVAGELFRARVSTEPPESLYRSSLPREELSAWLERKARAADEWTVLVAGGDLVIEDEGIVDVATPLLLVAGGRIRAEGTVRQAFADSVWFLGRGGGLEYSMNLSPNLVIDPPLENPLSEPLRLAAVSSQIPRSDRAVRWDNPIVIGNAGSGSYSVRYLLASDGLYDREQAVDHPRLLDGAGAIRVLVEFHLPDRKRTREWDPPWIDSIHFSWEPLEEQR